MEEIPLESSGNSANSAPVQTPRFHAEYFSFMPPPGWEVIDFGQALLVRQSDDESIFAGEQNQSPFVYMRLRDAGEQAAATGLDVVGEMKGLVAGVQSAEPAAVPILDGARGVGQFVEGYNDAIAFRAYLLTVPVNAQSLEIVFWGPRDEWATVAAQMATILETIRFPEI